MDGSFACPECGCEIHLTGLSPGRQVSCDWCQSRVEIPFIPRADQITRMRRSRFSARRKRLPAWAWLAFTMLTAAIALAGASRAVRSRWRSAECEALAGLVQSSQQAESAGRLDEALSALEGALTIALRTTPPPTNLDSLLEHRDRLSRQEAESSLLALEASKIPLDPAHAVGLALTLQARSHKDPALSTVTDRIAATLAKLRLAWVVAEADEARSANIAGQPDKALALAEHFHYNADNLLNPHRARWQAEAAEIAGQVIARHGTLVEPIRGQFTLGSPAAYAPLINPPLLETLKNRGYLPRPPSPLWSELWSSLAPYKVTLEINERFEDTYLSSQSRLSDLDAHLVLSRQGINHWGEAPRARTQVPLPGLSAYQASRLSVGDRRSAEAERLLYENARTNLIERLDYNLRNIPPCLPKNPGPLPSPPLAIPAKPAV